MEYIERRQNKVKELLVVVDMQNDFVFGALGTREARAVLPAVKKKAEEARGAGKRAVSYTHLTLPTTERV